MHDAGQYHFSWANEVAGAGAKPLRNANAGLTLLSMRC